MLTEDTKKNVLIFLKSPALTRDNARQGVMLKKDQFYLTARVDKKLSAD